MCVSECSSALSSVHYLRGQRGGKVAGSLTWKRMCIYLNRLELKPPVMHPARFILMAAVVSFWLSFSRQCKYNMQTMGISLERKILAFNTDSL